MRDLLEDGRRTERPVTIHVEIFNPARHWYERLGFRPVADNGVYLLMEWRPGTGCLAASQTESTLCQTP
jgi:hypothetical protein